MGGVARCGVVVESVVDRKRVCLSQVSRDRYRVLRDTGRTGLGKDNAITRVTVNGISRQAVNGFGRAPAIYIGTSDA